MFPDVISYQFDRVYSVKFGKVCSKPFNCTSGTPQGNNVSPLLIVLFINEVSIVLRDVKFLMNANDMKIYASVQYSMYLQTALKSFKLCLHR